MTLRASIGVAQASDGKEAGLQAAHKALNQLGAEMPRLALLIASNQYSGRDVLSGVASLLGEVPLVGFSAPVTLSPAGRHPHSVTLALLSGDFEAEAQWLPGYAQSGRETASRLKQHLEARPDEEQAILFFADGFNGDAEQLCANLQPAPPMLVGGLSSGDLHSGSTYQMATNQVGVGALAAACLRGNLRLGIGAAHGWDPVGSQFRVTRARGFWLRTLDGRPASEAYADLFGSPAREWAFPPLSYLARLYPLGVEQGEEIVVRAPIRVEADGSFRMNATVRDGVDAFLLIGSRASCEKAAAQAAQQALLALNGLRPAFALVLADIAWDLLLRHYPALEVGAVQDILGADVPLMGGYTLGQVIPSKERGAAPLFLNQHIVVVAFGEEEQRPSLA